MEEITVCLHADDPKERRGELITQKCRRSLERDLEEVAGDGLPAPVERLAPGPPSAAGDRGAMCEP